MNIIYRILLIYFAVYSVLFSIIFAWLSYRRRTRNRRVKGVDDKKEMIQ